jgi:hypothetical protein
MAWTLAQAPVLNQPGGNAISLTVTLGSQVTAGDLVIVSGRIPSNAGAAVITDSSPGGVFVWSKDVGVWWNNTGDSLVIYHAIAPVTVSSLAITATSPVGQNSFMNLAACDYQHGGTPQRDATGSGQGVGTALSGSSLVLSGSDELCYMHCSDNVTDETYSVSLPWTIRAQAGGFGTPLAVCDVRGASGTVVPAATMGSSATWMLVASSYVVSGPGPTVGGLLLNSGGVSPYPARRHVMPCTSLDVEMCLWQSKHRRTPRP